MKPTQEAGYMVDTSKKLNKNGKSQGIHPNSLKNLHPRLKGNNHAKKDYSITRIIKEMLDQPAVERWLEVEDKHKEITWRQAIAKRILIEAVKGNAKVTGELLDRLEGKVTQTIAGEGEKGEIIFKVVYEHSNRGKGVPDNPENPSS